MDDTIGRRIFGTLNTAVAALALWGGAQEVFAYWGQEVLPVAIGAAGVIAGGLLGLSGLALWTAHRAARRLALLGGAATTVVHGAGVLLGIVGYGALLVAVAYPAGMMAWVRRSGPASPDAPATASRRDEGARDERPDARPRVSVVLAG